MKLQIMRLNDKAKVPSFGHEYDAGMDLFCAKEITIASGARAQVETGIALAIPDGYVGLIWDKSGLSHKKGLKTLGGVVDAGYRGEVLVGMVNLGDCPHAFSVGDKVAQMLIQKVEHLLIEEVLKLDDTLRGRKGFGSTGV